jgi:hypothetical protein
MIGQGFCLRHLLWRISEKKSNEKSTEKYDSFMTKSHSVGGFTVKCSA